MDSCWSPWDMANDLCSDRIMAASRDPSEASSEGIIIQSPNNANHDESKTEQLIQLLKGCITQLKDTQKKDAFSPIFLLAQAALQEYSAGQMQMLQTGITSLQAQQKTEEQRLSATLKNQRKQDDEKAAAAAAAATAAAAAATATAAKDLISPASSSPIQPHTAIPSIIPTQRQTKNSASSENNVVSTPPPANFPPTKEQPQASASASASASAPAPAPAPAKNSYSHLTPLEQQKKVAMDKRRQEVLDQRRKAAAVQKQKEQEGKLKFLEKERRKEELKTKAASEAAEQKKKALQAGQGKGGSRMFGNVRLSPTITPKATPISPSGAKTAVGSTASSSANSRASSNTTTHTNHPTSPISPISLGVPSLPAQTQPVAPQSAPMPQATNRRTPQPSSLPTAGQIPQHPPTGIDMKYRNMMAQQPPPVIDSNQQQNHDEPDPTIMTELKRNILVQWALQPPSCQILKPVDQLLCSIHTIYPPSFSVSGHHYFTSWQALERSTLLTNTQLDETKLKKAVRKLRFFLHPDKLPRDLDPPQSFLCKLLWDITNDAYEDHKQSKDLLDWVSP